MCRDRDRALRHETAAFHSVFFSLSQVTHILAFFFIRERREAKFNLSICIRAGIKIYQASEVVLSVCYYFSRKIPNDRLFIILHGSDSKRRHISVKNYIC